MTKTAMLTAEQLREALDYDPATGLFRWKVQPSSKARVKADDIAGCLTTDGYRHIMLDRKWHLAHRLAWLHMHGVWPIDQLDHRNGVRDDNRIANLREATRRQNSQNQRLANRTNTSGLLGAYPNHDRWRAQIRFGGRCYNLGTFDTPEAAHAAYLAAKRHLHPFWNAPAA